MAERQYNATQLVALPRLKAHELLALARALLAAANHYAGLPGSVVEAIADLEAAATALAAALAPRERAEPVSMREVDRVADNAVAALVDACRAWLRLPREVCPDEGAVAEACVSVFAEDGTLNFLTFKSVVQHSEVQRRIDTLVAKGIDRDLRAIGMGPFVDHLLDAQATYGEACAVNRSPVKEESPALRAAVDEATDAARTYVVRVVGSVSRRRPETQERADALLEPLRAWTTAAPKTQAEDEEPAKDATPTKDAAPRVPTNAPPANDAAEEAHRKVG